MMCVVAKALKTGTYKGETDFHYLFRHQPDQLLG